MTSKALIVMTLILACIIALIFACILPSSAQFNVEADSQPNPNIIDTPGLTVGTAKTLLLVGPDGVVMDGDMRPLHELPMDDQVRLLCEALEGVTRLKFTRCGGK